LTNRRTFVAMGVGALLAGMRNGVHAQPTADVWRIGWLANSLDARVQEVFSLALRERGHVEGRNLVVLRRFAEGRDERFPALAAELAGLKPDVIVSLTGPGTAATKAATATIPIVMVGISDPVERLRSIHEQMVGLKDSHQAVAGNVLVNLAGFAPPVLLSVGLRTAVSMMRGMPQRSVNTVTTNVPGPQIPLYACGREMLEYFPFVPVSHGVRVGVAILSYNGKLGFGVTGDWDSAPDVDVLAHGIEEGMRELLALASPARPKRRRAVSA